MPQQRYAATLVTEHRRVFVPVPFDPDVAWGHKVEHHVRGTINGMDVRGVLEPLDNGRELVLGPAWRRDRHLESGAAVEVMLEPEDRSATILPTTSPLSSRRIRRGSILRLDRAVLPTCLPPLHRRNQTSSRRARCTHHRGNQTARRRREGTTQGLNKRRTLRIEEAAHTRRLASGCSSLEARTVAVGLASPDTDGAARQTSRERRSRTCSVDSIGVEVAQRRERAGGTWTCASFDTRTCGPGAWCLWTTQFGNWWKFCRVPST